MHIPGLGWNNDDGQLHLVEVYQCDNRFFRGLLQRVQQLMFRLRGTGDTKRE
jgi:hypothetical protein